MIALVAASQDITRNKQWVFRFFATVEDEVPPIISILKIQNIHKLGILYLNDEYGKSCYGLIDKRFTAEDKIVRSLAFQSQRSDFGKLIDQMMDTEAVYVIGYVNHTAQIYRQLRTKDYKGIILGASPAANSRVKTLPEAEGTYLAAPAIFNQQYLLAQELNNKYTVRYHSPLNQQEATGYDVIKLLLIVLFIIAVAFFSINSGLKYLMEAAGQNSVFIAAEMLKRIGSELDTRLIDIVSFTQRSWLQHLLAESNREFSTLKDRDAVIASRNQDWLAKDPKNELFIEKLTSSEQSEALRQRFILLPEVSFGRAFCGDVFVTNRYGVNVCQTNRTSDYYQADEKWWQSAKEKGVYWGCHGYDESAGAHGIVIAVRIDDMARNFAGVAKIFIPYMSIIRHADIHVRVYQTTQTQVFSNEGRLLYSLKPAKLFKDFSDDPIFQNFTDQSGYFHKKDD